MNVRDYLERATKEAKSFRKDANAHLQRNGHMNRIEKGEELEQRHIDAILTGFINHIGVNMGYDYCLYQEDLEKD